MPIFVVSSHKNVRMLCEPPPNLFLEESVNSRACTNACIAVIVVSRIGILRVILVIEVNVGQKIRSSYPCSKWLSVTYKHLGKVI